jgi:hypothetical protein
LRPSFMVLRRGAAQGTASAPIQNPAAAVDTTSALSRNFESCSYTRSCCLQPRPAARPCAAVRAAPAAPAAPDVEAAAPDWQRAALHIEPAACWPQRRACDAHAGQPSASPTSGAAWLRAADAATRLAPALSARRPAIMLARAYRDRSASCNRTIQHCMPPTPVRFLPVAQARPWALPDLQGFSAG